MKRPPLMNWAASLDHATLSQLVHSIQMHELFDTVRWASEIEPAPALMQHNLIIIANDTIARGAGIGDVEALYRMYDFCSYVATYRGLRVEQALPIERLITPLAMALTEYEWRQVDRELEASKLKKESAK